MREIEPIELTDGQTLLVAVKEDRVAEFTWDMGLPHVEFVETVPTEVPAGSSQYFFGYQLPAPGPVMAAVRAVFK